MDVSAYLDRINYRGSTEPTIETLRALQRAHLLAVPFENLVIHLSRRIVMNEAALFEKIVVHRRGGFCYALNTLFAGLLHRLGFAVTIFSATVLHGGIPAEIDHLTLLIQLGERWIADVGFGDSSRLPLRLDYEGEQHGVDATCRIIRTDDRWLSQRLLETNEWYDEYIFRLDSLTLDDFRDACVYYETAPASYFVQGRICSRGTEDGRICLTDDALIVTRNGQREETPLDGEGAFARALSEHSGIQIR